MFFPDDLTSPVNNLNSVESKESSLSPINSYVNSVGFRPLVVRMDSELYSRSTDGSIMDNRMDSPKFTHLEFNEKNETVNDDTSISHNGSPVSRSNAPMRKSSSHSLLRLGTPLNVPNTSKSKGSTFHLLGTKLDSSSPKSRSAFSLLESPVLQKSPKTESIHMTLDDSTLNSPKKQADFVDAGVEVPGLEHRFSMDSQDYHSVFSSSRLSSFAPEPGSFFDLAQYKARLEEQLSLNKSDSMRKADCNDSLEYKLFRETQEYNNLVNYSNSMYSELSDEPMELGSMMDSTKFDRFSHFGYSFNKLLNSLTWLASLHLSCRNSNLYLNRYDNNNINQQQQPEGYHQTSCRYDIMDTLNGGENNYYQSTSVHQYPVNYVTDHDMTPEVQTTMQGYPVYSNTINNTMSTIPNFNKNNIANNNTTINYTMSNTQIASNRQQSFDNLINIDNDFNMDNNYNYCQPSFSNRNYNTSKVKADNNYNSGQYFNTQNYNQGKGYYTNQLKTYEQQHTINQNYQQTTQHNNYNTSVTNENNQRNNTDVEQKQKNYRGKYFYNNRMINGVEQEVYDLDVDLGITNSRKV